MQIPINLSGLWEKPLATQIFVLGHEGQHADYNAKAILATQDFYTPIKES